MNICSIVVRFVRRKLDAEPPALTHGKALSARPKGITMKNVTRIIRKLSVLMSVGATCLGVFSARSTVAATATWNGGAVPDGNWMTPGNWSFS